MDNIHWAFGGDWRLLVMVALLLSCTEFDYYCCDDVTMVTTLLHARARLVIAAAQAKGFNMQSISCTPGDHAFHVSCVVGDSPR
jgi:hypothetical protein